MTIRLPWLAFGAALLLLPGCTTDDPNRGGLLGGLFGLGSGDYEQRIAEEKAALRAEEVRYRDHVEHNATLDQALKARRARAADLQREIAALQQDVDAVDAEIAALQSEESATRDEVEKAQTDVALLREEIDRIEAEQAANEQAKALGADAGADTDPAAFGEPPREQVSDLRAYINKLQAAVDALKAARAKRVDETPAAPREAAD